MDVKKISFGKGRLMMLVLSFIMGHCSIHHAVAQTEISQYQPGITAEGAVYFLPITAIQFNILVEKATYTPGDFARYAGRHLRLNDVEQEPKTTYRVVSIVPQGVGIVDTTKAYSVKFNAKTVAANVALSEEGLLLAINAKPNLFTPAPPFKPAKKPAAINPRQYMNEDILSAGSTAKMAELTAREIYDLRENRNLLIKGQADFMPTDGAQMQLMLNQMDQQDKALTQLFQGITERDTTEHIITIVPTKSTNRRVLFRLSQVRGLVDIDDLSGEPFYVSIEDITNLPATQQTKGKKKLVETGIYVNVPGRMLVSIEHKEQTISATELPAPQFGNVELLSGDLFNKHYTTHLWLNPVSGGVDRLEAEQPK